MHDRPSRGEQAGREERPESSALITRPPHLGRIPGLGKERHEKSPGQAGALKFSKCREKLSNSIRRNDS
jgi:hypothetical protein